MWFLLARLGLAGVVPNEHGIVPVNPVWAPDGRRLAFETLPPGGLFLAELRGSSAERAERVEVPFAVSPVFRPNGYAVFAGSVDGRPVRLWYMESDVTARVFRGLRDVEGDLGSPDVSWADDATVFTGEGDLWHHSARTGRVSRLTSTPVAEDAPAFSPDGRALAFERLGDIVRMDLETLDEDVVADGPADQVRPRFAADGAIVFFQHVGTGGWELVAVRDGQHDLLADAIQLPHRTGPAVSPDGRWVAFRHADADRDDEIGLARTDGTGAIVVRTDHDAVAEPALGQQGTRTLLAYTAYVPASQGRRVVVTDITAELRTPPPSPPSPSSAAAGVRCAPGTGPWQLVVLATIFTLGVELSLRRR